MALGTLRDGGVAVGDGLHGDAELATSAWTHRTWGAMTPSSVVNGVAALIAWRRCAMTSSERTWWSRKKVSSVARREVGPL